MLLLYIHGVVKSNKNSLIYMQRKNVHIPSAHVGEFGSFTFIYF
jgi:hypothetical protein